jgi:hypothetical protein
MDKQLHQLHMGAQWHGTASYLPVTFAEARLEKVTNLFRLNAHDHLGASLKVWPNGYLTLVVNHPAIP